MKRMAENNDEAPEKKFVVNKIMKKRKKGQEPKEAIEEMHLLKIPVRFFLSKWNRTPILGEKYAALVHIILTPSFGV